MSNSRALRRSVARSQHQAATPKQTLSTYWNGQPTPAFRGTAIVADLPEFPEYWAKAEGIVGHRIQVVRVDYAGDTWYMDDRKGGAWHKVTEGFGGPRWAHRNVAIEPESFKAGGRA